jgi:hypothetical protein
MKTGTGNLFFFILILIFFKLNSSDAISSYINKLGSIY